MNVITTSTYNGVSTLVGPYTTGRGATLPNGNVAFIHGTACATLTPGCTFVA